MPVKRINLAVAAAIACAALVPAARADQASAAAALSDADTRHQNLTVEYGCAQQTRAADEDYYVSLVARYNAVKDQMNNGDHDECESQIRCYAVADGDAGNALTAANTSVRVAGTDLQSAHGYYDAGQWGWCESYCADVVSECGRGMTAVGNANTANTYALGFLQRLEEIVTYYETP